MSPLPIVVLCSGRGSNLQALIDAARSGELPIDIRAVVSDKPLCSALKRAQRAGIPTQALEPRDYADRRNFDEALFGAVARFDPQLIVFAGFMRIVEPVALHPWQGRMINIHPSLLPKYTGLRTHQRALDAGDAEHGASVHFVTAELDAGPVIAQAALPVVAGDDAATLAARLLPIEHRLLIATVGLIAAGRIRLGPAGVALDGRAIAAPLRLAAAGTLEIGC